MLKHSYILALILWTSLSCGAGEGREDKLQRAVFYFNEGIRWGRLQEVLARVDPGTEEHFLSMHKDFGEIIKVISCDVVNSKVNLETGEAQVGVKITWYRIDEMVEHSTVVMQYWEEKDRDWVMMREEFRSGTPF
jgi:hypothetical protein